MAFTVFRVGRLKGVGQVSAAFSHNLRTRPTPNADPTIDNEELTAWDDPASPWFVPSPTDAPSPWDVVHARIAAADKARLDVGLKVRKRGADYVPAVEMILSASHDHFLDRSGRRDPAKIQAFRDVAAAWMHERYGDRLIDMRLHLDERTPHLQAIVVPVTKDNRLSAKEMFSGKAHMSRMQTDFAAAVAHLGIQRGIEGSTATHTELKNYYAALTAPDPAPIAVTVSVPPLLAKRKGWATRESERLTREIAPAIEEAVRPGKLAKIATRQAAQAQATSVAVRKWAQETVDAKELERRIDVEAAQHSRDVAQKSRDVAQAARQEAQDALAAERKEVMARMRDIPIQDVLRAAGWDVDPRDRDQWRGPNQGRISIQGAKWFDHDAGKGGGKAIDLAKHITGQDFEGAMAWLGGQFGVAPAQAAMRAKAEEPPPMPRPFELPAHDPAKIPQVRDYLTQARGLSEQLVDRLLETGRLLAESYRGYVNAVFVMRDRAGEAVGAEKRGTSSPFSGLAGGSSRNEGWFRTLKGTNKAQITTVVVTESAIDALSALELIPVPKGELWRFVSTAGARPNAPWLRAMVQAGQRLLVAFDADETGESMAEAMIRAYPTQAARLVPPVGKDWNDTLRARSDGGELAEKIDRTIREQLDEADEAAVEDTTREPGWR